MRFIRFAPIAALIFSGCLGSYGTDSTNPRIVSGKLVTAGYQLDNPVVIAESGDHRVFVTHLQPDGSFQLQLPSNVAYRLTVANSTRSSTGFASVARINWPLSTGASRWAKLGGGAPLDLGHVFTRGSTQYAIQCSGCSGGSGGYMASQGSDCHEDDHDYCSKSSSEDDCDSDHKYKDDDHCDKDDDADQHDKDCDQDDHDKGAGGYADGGSAASGGHDDDDGHGSCNCGSDGGASSSSSSCSSGGSGGSGGTGPSSSYGSGGSIGTGCMTNSDCAIGLSCVASFCVPIK
jgi:hypothetical protein